jgi:hypothetical protein
MQDQPTSSSATSEYFRFAGCFHLLGIDPSATSAQVQEAYAVVCAQGAAPSQLSTQARDSILDPLTRLLCELTYPSDSTAGQIEAFHEGLSANTPASERLATAATLQPLSKANFLTGLAARQPADGSLLSALVEAHAAIEATTIFEALRKYRSRSDLAMPSLVEIRQALQQLVSLQSDTVMSTYAKIQDATAPLLECVRLTLSSDDRYRIEALSGLLNVYRRSLDAADPGNNHDINAACEGVRLRPEDESAVKEFEIALVGLMSPKAPLMLFDAHQNLRNDEVDGIAGNVSNLLADLIASRNYETARKLLPICVEAFGSMPEVIAPFQQTATVLQSLALEAKIKPAQNSVDGGDKSTKASHPRIVFFVTLVAAAICAIFLSYRYFDLPSSPFAASIPAAPPRLAPEIIPPVSKGERFKLDFVRYCHFQEERLRVVKQHVQGPEDIRAYNMLANDYNSRCSNFFYLDEDLKTVTEEVKAKRQMLEADAMRILSTWPWHAPASGNAIPSAK